MLMSVFVYSFVGSGLYSIPERLDSWYMCLHVRCILLKSEDNSSCCLSEAGPSACTGMNAAYWIHCKKQQNIPHEHKKHSLFSMLSVKFLFLNKDSNLNWHVVVLVVQRYVYGNGFVLLRLQSIHLLCCHPSSSQTAEAKPATQKTAVGSQTEGYYSQLQQVPWQPEKQAC